MSTYGEVCHVMATMPPLRHSHEGEYDARKCEIVQWAITQEPVAQWLFEMLKGRGLIRFDAASGQWHGVPVEETLEKATRSRTASDKSAARTKQRSGGKSRKRGTGKPGRHRTWTHDQIMATLETCPPPATFENWLTHAKASIGIGRTAFSRYIRELVASAEIVKVGRAYAKKIETPELGEEIPL